jgi:regulator of RNase E activity RraA
MEIDRKKILELYKGLRVTDVVDGMDAIGLQDTGTMTPDIHPLWRDIENFKHCFMGFAMTVRFMPTNRAIHAKDIEDYKRIKSEWYGQVSENEVYKHMQPGDVLIVDGDIKRDIGYWGSNNAYAHYLNGFVGFVTNGHCRDSDELIKQQVPIYFRTHGRGIRPGRLEIDGVNIPVNVGGVLVRPGDFVVADGDGVVVVPIEHVYEVGEFAREVAEGDKESRRKLYEKAGKPFDFTCY